LLSAAVATFSKKGKPIHLNAGSAYFGGMVGIFLTAIPMSLLTGNIFLFLIAMFSFHLAFSGRRFAKNRTGIAQRIDWIANFLMLFSGVGMWRKTIPNMSLWSYLDSWHWALVITIFEGTRRRRQEVKNVLQGI